MTYELLWALQPETAGAVLANFASLLESLNLPEKITRCGIDSEAVLASDHSTAAAPGYYIQNGVAVIPVQGVITRRFTWPGYAISQDDIAAAIDAALADSSVRGILLDINSPGGVVAGTKELADKIAAATTIKPMSSYDNGLMASAALWLGAATGRIFAPLTGTIGSIGVLQLHTDWSKFNERLGISYTYITAGRFKAAGNENSPLDDAAKALFQKQVDQLHAIFKADVAKALTITAQESQWAEGQTMLAEEARSLGLVQSIVSDRQEAITLLNKEFSMDLATLTAQHPELLAQIKKLGAEEALAAKAQSATQSQTDLLAMVGLVAGAETMTSIQSLLEAKVTPEQLKAMSSLFPSKGNSAAQERQEQTTEQDKKAQILATLQKVTPNAVNGGVPQAAPGKSPLVADAERRAELAKNKS